MLYCSPQQNPPQQPKKKDYLRFTSLSASHIAVCGLAQGRGGWKNGRAEFLVLFEPRLISINHHQPHSPPFLFSSFLTSISLLRIQTRTYRVRYSSQLFYPIASDKNPPACLRALAGKPCPRYRTWPCAASRSVFPSPPLHPPPSTHLKTKTNTLFLLPPNSYFSQSSSSASLATSSHPKSTVAPPPPQITTSSSASGSS